ncbi:unnamed protein product, partial [Arctia plantaginis]
MISIKLGIKLEEQDVVYAKRAGNGRSNYEESEEKAPRPRVIVVRLTRRETREELLRSAR